MGHIARAARRLTGAGNAIALIGMTDRERLPDPFRALSALPRGSALVWRAYDDAADARTIRRLGALARSKGCVLLLAGHPRLGTRLGMQGLHLPERMFTRRYENGYLLSLPALAPGMELTGACHSEAAIHAAARAGMDAVLISPVFPTRSHPGERTLGVVKFARLARLARKLGMAPCALGGIVTLADIRRLAGTGAAGVAGISLLLP